MSSHKRILLCILATLLALLLVGATPKFGPAFSDIDGHWAEDVIEEMANQGVINGYEDGTFRPDASVSREETVAMIARLFPAFVNEPVLDLKTGYVDIDGRWSSDYLHSAIRAGLVNGYSDFTFRPSAPITRVDAALLLVKAYFYESPSKDQSANLIWIPVPSTEAVNAIANSEEALSLYLADNSVAAIEMRYQVFTPLAALKEHGIMQGYPDGSMGWSKSLTRAEFCTILDRIQGWIEKLDWESRRHGIFILSMNVWHPAGEIDPKAAIDRAGEYFEKTFPDPVERARAIYDTMILNYVYDYKAMFGHRPCLARTPGITVRSGVGICHHFASVYTLVAQAAGLNAFRISGYVESPATAVDGDAQEPQKEDHAWVSVTIGDRVIDLDPTWGLGSKKVYFDNLDQYEHKWIEESRTDAVSID